MLGEFTIRGLLVILCVASHVAHAITCNAQLIDAVDTVDCDSENDTADLVAPTVKVWILFDHFILA